MRCSSKLNISRAMRSTYLCSDYKSRSMREELKNVRGTIGCHAHLNGAEGDFVKGLGTLQVVRLMVEPLTPGTFKASTRSSDNSEDVSAAFLSHPIFAFSPYIRVLTTSKEVKTRLNPYILRGSRMLYGVCIRTRVQCGLGHISRDALIRGLSRSGDDGGELAESRESRPSRKWIQRWVPSKRLVDAKPKPGLRCAAGPLIL